ncbi:hypothetical protein BVRB_030940, partial [Beta vulgaris subsp. vulgaris]
HDGAAATCWHASFPRTLAVGTRRFCIAAPRLSWAPQREIVKRVPEPEQQTAALAAHHQLPTMKTNYAIVDVDHVDEDIIRQGSKLFEKYMLESWLPEMWFNCNKHIAFAFQSHVSER